MPTPTTPRTDGPSRHLAAAAAYSVPFPNALGYGPQTNKGALITVAIAKGTKPHWRSCSFDSLANADSGVFDKKWRLRPLEAIPSAGLQIAARFHGQTAVYGGKTRSESKETGSLLRASARDQPLSPSSEALRPIALWSLANSFTKNGTTLPNGEGSRDGIVDIRERLIRAKTVLRPHRNRVSDVTPVSDISSVEHGRRMRAVVGQWEELLVADRVMRHGLEDADERTADTPLQEAALPCQTNGAAGAGAGVARRAELVLIFLADDPPLALLRNEGRPHVMRQTDDGWPVLGVLWASYGMVHPSVEGGSLVLRDCEVAMIRCG
ncbi:hypothetical protein CSOJ01_04408 [Colletotrichum sojae]|uniref:Uncharacterized protein n=1 Tax=Colletotrichum sojae TaxID=2175907 RepID=A0A8H6MZC2_9PEZI|nr:hypothetical protein CSOJ01_04408 [Colletotrichum sojae]